MSYGTYGLGLRPAYPLKEEETLEKKAEREVGGVIGRYGTWYQLSASYTTLGEVTKIEISWSSRIARVSLDMRSAGSDSTTSQ